MGESSGAPPSAETPPNDRLDSWKEIAAYLRRDVTTVQRWEKREGMPIHRHVHEKLGSVYAYRSELDTWVAQRNPRPVDEESEAGEPPDNSDRSTAAADARPALAPLEPPATPSMPPKRRWSPVVATLATGALLLAAGATWWLVHRSDDSWRNPLDDAKFQMLTDFDGTEQAAAISRDGRFVAFASDRDGPMDVWVTQVGAGQFHNLTRGRVRDLVNPSVRTLGFSPDGALVTFWARAVEGSNAQDIDIWAVPALGGDPRPYLEGVAEFDWSHDGARLVYHTPGPGDPMFVKDSGQPAGRQPVHAAPPGLHAHFPTWSPDGAFIYFVQGSLSDAMDIWRIRPSGHAAERITNHDAAVSHPILLNHRMLLYLVSEGDGTGPRLHALDVERRVPHLLGTGLDRYTSLSVSADGRRLVATLANPKRTLWRLPIGDAPADASAASPILLPTGRGFSARLGQGYLLYASAMGTRVGIWKLADGAATELWSAPETRILGGPDIAPDGQRIAFTVEQHGRTLLYVMNADGTKVRVVSESLELRGSPAWAPDGQSIVSGASVNGTPHLFRIDLDGPPVPLIRGFAADPVWSPAGDFFLYSGADVGTMFPVRAATAAGGAFHVLDLTLTRGARRLRFFPGRRAIVAMLGEILHKNLWLIDLETGAQRQLTNLPPDFGIRDFDVSSDGREVVVERWQEHSDVVLIDLARHEPSP